MKTTPLVNSSIVDLQKSLLGARAQGMTIALVPTMGALHEGHLTLVDEARRHGQFVVATIFVNPTQFAPGEDLDSYPKDLESDLEKLGSRGVNLVFTPDKSEIYPPGFRTSVAVSDLTTKLCGISRPDHFGGVTTVVSKLFNIVGPCTAVFGRKDYQQLQVIKRMTKDLNMPVDVIGAPTLRELDGLAMSSRNANLSDDEHNRALAISTGLISAHQLFNQGTRNVGLLRQAVEGPVREAADELLYVTATHHETLEELSDNDDAPDKMLIAVAVKIGTTRLIDNTVLGEDQAPVGRV